ncbi:MAG: hydrogenase maturation protease, partial [Gemmatimonadota bacterium]|nr:hydrogenase maturation protease [Gemmatimonadota bacterium]
MIDAETVVLGVGSPLMGDDGLGVAVVRMVEEEWPSDSALAFLDGGTWGMRVLPFIETARRLLIVDAIKAGGAPGTIVRLEDAQIPRHLRQKLSPHQ